MRVLIDECLPRQLRRWLTTVQPDWAVSTVQDAGWAAMKNGALLRVANASFDVLLTADKNMHHQQNFVGLDISVLVFPTNRARLVLAGVPAMVQSVARVSRGQKAVMDLAAGRAWGQALFIDVVLEGDISRHVFDVGD